MNTHKVARMGAAAFLNSCRLHRDAVLLHESERYPSAFLMSVLAQEELGKAHMLEEYVWRVGLGEIDPNDDTHWFITELRSHVTKQALFESHTLNLDDLRWRRFAEESSSGKLERRKQDATYVGLTRDHSGKRMDYKGRIVRPATRVGARRAAEQITRVGDALTELVEGYLLDEIIVDTEEFEACLTRELLVDLGQLWAKHSRSTRKMLARWRARAS